MTDYTPTTLVVKDAVTFPRERLGEPRPIKPEAFDRWLEQVKAEAWEEGMSSTWPEMTKHLVVYANNPYRQKEQDR